jgi:hypothetical protein
MPENKRQNLDYVEPFVKPIKIFLFKDRNRVKMTVMVRPTFGITYLWEQEEFERMLENWQNEFEGKALGANVFVGPKKSKDPQMEGEKYVRVSIMSQYGTEHRFSFRTFMDLEREYYHQKTNKMPWDKDTDAET